MLAFPASSWASGRHQSSVVTLSSPLMSATLSFDRTAFLNVAVTVDFGVEASLDGGATWPLLVVGGRTVGGALLDALGNTRTVHSVSRDPDRDKGGNPLPIAPIGTRVRAYMAISGGTAVLGAGTLEVS